MNKYQRQKAQARQTATEWQLDFKNHNYSYSELFYFQSYFKKLGTRYGLLTEFEENGII